MIRIGLISDTHGLLRPEAKAFLRGCDRIVHAGDICGPEVLETLAQIAPLTAVRGNNDRGDWAQALDETEALTLGGLTLYVIHEIMRLDIEPRAAGVDVVVYGHSHQPQIERRDGVLYVNPGSAGPRRFKLPVSVAELIVDGGFAEARVVDLV